MVELVSGVAGLSWRNEWPTEGAQAGRLRPGRRQRRPRHLGLRDDQGQEDEITLLFGGYGGASCYARLQDSSMVYLVDAAIVDPLLTANAASVAPMTCAL